VRLTQQSSPVQEEIEFRSIGELTPVFGAAWDRLNTQQFMRKLVNLE
jgi:hypothetical protein